jgi:hypothetical protein
MSEKPSLADVLGAAMTEIENARQLADEHAARIARRYRADPLLEGMAVPRVRFKDVILEIPMLIDRLDTGTPEESTPRVNLSELLKRRLTRLDVGLPEADVNDLITRFDRDYEDTGKLHGLGGRQRAVAALTTALTEAAATRDPARRRVLEDLREPLREIVAGAALTREPVPPTLRLRVVTDDVRTHATPDTVTRVRIHLKEEGLEWSETVLADGQRRGRLTPE